MRIGIVPNFDPSIGGAYQYAVTLVGAVRELQPGDEFVLFTYVGENPPAEITALNFETHELRRVTGAVGAVARAVSRVVTPSTRERLGKALGKAQGGSGDVSAEAAAQPSEVDPLWTRFFRRHGIELLVFTNDSDLSFKTGIPFVVAVHDLQHRLHPEFEEVSADGEGERREYRVGNAVRGATAILVDSDVGKEDMVCFYGPEGVDADEVFALPFLPADYLGTSISAQDRSRVRETYHLPDTYFFYPAQFSPSKNHVRIVEAVARLAREGLPVHIALAGPHSGALRERVFAEVTDLVRELGVEEAVQYLGYVPDEDMSALYAESVGLVMPTFFGPTNIPILEAWRVDCPVITSDVRGISEQAGDAALLVDPESTDAITDAMRRLLTEPALRADLAAKGRMRLASYPRAEFVRRLGAALDEAKRRVAASATNRDPDHEERP